MINRSLLNLGYLATRNMPSIFMSVKLVSINFYVRLLHIHRANLSKFVIHFHVCKFHAWTLGPTISRLDILMVNHFHVRHFECSPAKMPVFRQMLVCQYDRQRKQQNGSS